MSGFTDRYIWRSLTPSQAAAVVEAHAAGTPARELAAAYGVSTRTIWRTIRRDRSRHVVVQVEAWRAEFVITDDGPYRATPWYSVPA